MITKEKIIELLISKYDKSNTNIVLLYKDDLLPLKITEDEASRALLLMESDNMIKIQKKSIHNDFSICWRLELLPSCVEYFENKKQQRKQNRNQWIQFWIPLVVSIIGF